MNKLSDLCLLSILFTVSLFAAGCQLNQGLWFHPREEVAPLSDEVENLNDRLNSGLYFQKIDHLFLVIDDTTSMADLFAGSAKRDIANNMMKRIIRTIPEITLNKAIRIYGPNVDDDQRNTSLTHGLSLSPTAEIRSVVLTKTMADSQFNPLAMALDGAYHELKLVKGNTAIILLSDFNDPREEMVRSALLIKKYYGDNVCLYPIVMGSDGPGRDSAEKITAAVGCGMTALSDALVTGPALADFMEKVLFTKQAPLSPYVPITVQKDEGELSYKKMVEEKKLTIELKTEFDFDKVIIRPEYMDHLQKIAEFMKTYQDTVTTIEGHTCSIGTEKYNLGLSSRRAESVKQLLVSLGIDESRVSIASFGETRPIADNTTEEGRQKNRRAVAVITTTKQTDE